MSCMHIQTMSDVLLDTLNCLQYLWIQIQSFIKTLGLDTSVNYTKPPPSLHEDNASEEQTKQETIDIEKDKPVDQPEKKEKKKKKKKKKGSGESESETITSVGPRDDEEIRRQLLQLSVKSYKRLLVSMDDEAVWYEQVRQREICNQQSLQTF